jgi:glycosyltransferase involved in cell wall biosynthesis
LVEQGVQTTVLTTDAMDADQRVGLPRDRMLNGIRVLTVPNLSNRLAYRHQLFLPRNVSATLEALGPVDVIHLHGHRHLLNTFAVRFARKNGIPTVLTANGTLPRHERKVALKALWDVLIAGHIPLGASRCIAVSQAEVRQYRAAGIPFERIVEIPNGLDLAEFSPLPKRGALRARLGIPDSQPLVAYLGQISPRKGVEHLVAAFAADPPRGAALAIGGNDMGALRAAKRACPAGAPVHFLGLLKGEERVQLLVDADVLVYPSTGEVFGLVPFEGLLSGTPVVVGDDCGCGELIQKAGAGLLVRHSDVLALRHKIGELLADRDRAQQMVNRGRCYVRENLAFPHVAELHRALYAEVVAAGKAMDKPARLRLIRRRVGA